MVILLSPGFAQQIGEGFEYSKYIHASEIKVTSISLQILLKLLGYCHLVAIPHH